MLIEEGFIENLDIEMFEKINKLIRSVINLMCNGKNFQTWYSVEKANQSTVCPDTYWNAIKKVIFTL